MNEKMKIQEVIIVEGKDDTKRIIWQSMRIRLKPEVQRSVMRL